MLAMPARGFRANAPGRSCQTRRDGVDGDAVRAELARQRPREAHDAALAGDIECTKPVVTEPKVLDPMLTTRPQPRCLMPGTNAELTRNTLSRLIDSTGRQSANVI